jgi:hypothetical protein
MTEEKSFFSFKFEEPAPKQRRVAKRLRAPRRPALTIAQIMEWADAHHARTGKWPNIGSGYVHENRDEKWANINQALIEGLRTLPRWGSLASLLIEKRGARFRNCRPALTVSQILEWADAHKQRTGAWPTADSGAVAGVVGEVWGNIDQALINGNRDLPGGSSIARLLSTHRGTRNKMRLPGFTIDQILSWADAHRIATGQWPTHQSGSVAGARGETWFRVDKALRDGLRSLGGGSSLARLLTEYRGQRNHMDLPSLTVTQILDWADAHFRLTGRWPVAGSGPIEGAAGENCHAINYALIAGTRGLPGGTTLVRLLAKRRGRQNPIARPALTVKQILGWADAHWRRTGRWPTCGSGPVADTAGEHWATLDLALAVGRRGLPGGSSLSRLLDQHRRRSRTSGG